MAIVSWQASLIWTSRTETQRKNCLIDYNLAWTGRAGWAEFYKKFWQNNYWDLMTMIMMNHVVSFSISDKSLQFPLNVNRDKWLRRGLFCLTYDSPILSLVLVAFIAVHINVNYKENQDPSNHPNSATLDLSCFILSRSTSGPAGRGGSLYDQYSSTVVSVHAGMRRLSAVCCLLSCVNNILVSQGQCLVLSIKDSSDDDSQFSSAPLYNLSLMWCWGWKLAEVNVCNSKWGSKNT